MHDPYIIEPHSFEWYYVNIASLIGIIFFLGVSYFLFNYRYSDNKGVRSKITKFLGFLLLARLLIHHAYAISENVWDINHSLPFHLCGISSMLCIFILFRYNQLIYEFLLLLGAPGALWSFLTPQINISQPLYMYVDYFISHAAIIAVPIFLTICAHKKPRALSYFKIFIIMNIFIMPLVAIVNIMIKNVFNSKIVNYMYLMHPPKADNPFVVDGWMYMIVMEMAAFAHMFLVYSIFVFMYKFRSKYSPERRFA